MPRGPGRPKKEMPHLEAITKRLPKYVGKHADPFAKLASELGTSRPEVIKHAKYLAKKGYIDAELTSLSRIRRKIIIERLPEYVGKIDDPIARLSAEADIQETRVAKVILDLIEKKRLAPEFVDVVRSKSRDRPLVPLVRTIELVFNRNKPLESIQKIAQELGYRVDPINFEENIREAVRIGLLDKKLGNEVLRVVTKPLSVGFKDNHPKFMAALTKKEENFLILEAIVRTLPDAVESRKIPINFISSFLQISPKKIQLIFEEFLGSSSSWSDLNSLLLKKDAEVKRDILNRLDRLMGASRQRIQRARMVLERFSKYYDNPLVEHPLEKIAGDLGITWNSLYGELPSILSGIVPSEYFSLLTGKKT